jgi:fructose-6-phosphate aldolase 2
VDVVAQIVQLLRQYDLDTKVLAASFKNVQQVHSVALAGGQSVTVNPEILDAMLMHPLTDWSINQFARDWESVYGIGKITLDIK